MFNADAGLGGSARRALPVGNVDAYTVLVSLGGRRLSSRGPYIHYTEDACILFHIAVLLIPSKLQRHEVNTEGFFFKVASILFYTV